VLAVSMVADVRFEFAYGLLRVLAAGRVAVSAAVAPVSRPVGHRNFSSSGTSLRWATTGLARLTAAESANFRRGAGTQVRRERSGLSPPIHGQFTCYSAMGGHDGPKGTS
jgi:hypothetical protein